MRILIITLILFLPFMSYSQRFENYQWENRLLLIFTKDESGDKLNKQLKLLKYRGDELKERKLKVFHLTEKKYRELFTHNKGWKNREVVTEKYEFSDNFEVFLIGLDGGVKLRQKEILTADKLFQTIDSMPMRRAEIRNKT